MLFNTSNKYTWAFLLAAACSPTIDVTTLEPLPPLDNNFVPRPSTEADIVFDDTRVHEIEISLDEDEFNALLFNKDLEVRATFQFNDEPALFVGLKLRGNFGSFTQIDEKPKLGIDFNEYIPGQRLHEIEKLALNNERQDCSYLKEPLGYRVFSLAGVPAPRTGFAHVTLNGQDYGFYVLVESEDDRFLDARYSNPTGRLYDGKYRRDRWPLQRLDFDVDRDTLFELEEGTDAKHEDIIAVSDAARKAKRGDDVLAETSSLIDWAEAMRFFLVESWVEQGDGYTFSRNNYRVYFDPTDGRMDFLPFDLDVAFGSFRTIGEQGKLARLCLSDLTCAATMKGTAQQVVEQINPEELLVWYDSVAALTEPFASADPKRNCPAEQIPQERATLRSFIEQANQSLLREWGL